MVCHAMRGSRKAGRLALFIMAMLCDYLCAVAATGAWLLCRCWPGDDCSGDHDGRERGGGARRGAGDTCVGAERTVIDGEREL